MAVPPKTDRATTADCAQIAGLTYVQAEGFVQAILDELSRGKEVRLQGLGIFYVRPVTRRFVVSPMLPGGKAEISPRDQIRFRRSRGANEAVNQTPQERREARQQGHEAHLRRKEVAAKGRAAMLGPAE